MRKQVIAAAVFSALLSFFLMALSYEVSFRDFDGGIFGEFFYDESWLLLWPLLASVVGVATARASINEFHKRLAISGLLITGLLVWVLSRSMLVTVIVLIPALCIGAWLWIYDAKD